METVERRSRWDDSPRKDANGKLVPVVFTESDLEICKLLAPSGKVREPWSYQYLPASYIHLLLKRGRLGTSERLPELFCRPYSYITQPDQPKNNYRDIIWADAKAGIDQVREAGFEIRDTRLRRLPHELMACIIAASIEYGADKHGLVIDTDISLDLDFYPDRRVFRLAGKYVFNEADTGSETMEGKESATTIMEKYEQYLELDPDILKDSIILFTTTRATRRESMVQKLREYIDAKRANRELARHFAFTTIEYDRFLNKIPKLTDWAIANDWQRASSKHGPFNFLKP